MRKWRTTNTENRAGVTDGGEQGDGAQHDQQNRPPGEAAALLLADPVRDVVARGAGGAGEGRGAGDAVRRTGEADRAARQGVGLGAAEAVGLRQTGGAPPHAGLALLQRVQEVTAAAAGAHRRRFAGRAAHRTALNYAVRDVEPVRSLRADVAAAAGQTVRDSAGEALPRLEVESLLTGRAPRLAAGGAAEGAERAGVVGVEVGRGNALHASGRLVAEETGGDVELHVGGVQQGGGTGLTPAVHGEEGLPAGDADFRGGLEGFAVGAVGDGAGLAGGHDLGVGVSEVAAEGAGETLKSDVCVGAGGALVGAGETGRSVARGVDVESGVARGAGAAVGAGRAAREARVALLQRIVVPRSAEGAGGHRPRNDARETVQAAARANVVEQSEAGQTLAAGGGGHGAEPAVGHAAGQTDPARARVVPRGAGQAGGSGAEGAAEGAGSAAGVGVEEVSGFAEGAQFRFGGVVHGAVEAVVPVLVAGQTDAVVPVIPRVADVAVARIGADRAGHRHARQTTVESRVVVAVGNGALTAAVG